MASNRRGKTKRRSNKMPAADLVVQAVLEIERGSARKALKLLRRAKFRGASPELTDAPMHVAHLLRASKLEGAGWRKAAEAARKKAAEHSLDHADPALVEMALAIRFDHLPDKDCFQAYALHLRSSPANASVEAKLADRLVTNRCWEHIEVLDEKCQLRRDASIAATAVGPLDRGQWARGCQILRAIPAGSPFGHWRTWCHVMAAVESGDRNRVGQELARLPPDFPLRSTVKALRSWADRPARRASTSGGLIDRLLGVDRGEVSRSAAFLRHAVQGGYPAAIARAVDRFARAIDPVDSDSTRKQILLLLASKAGGETKALKTSSFMRPRLDTNRLRLRMAVQPLGAYPPDLEGLRGIMGFLEHIEVFFPDPDVRAIALGRILHLLAMALGVSEPIPETSSWPDFGWNLRNLAKIAGVPVDSLDDYGIVSTCKLQLLDLSVKVDPANAKAHQNLIGAIRGSIWYSRQGTIRAYENYAASVPEDPEPWISLAELRLFQNAYRKAAAALKKAGDLARPDERISNLQCVSLLLAAKNNIWAGRLPLATRDWEAARQCQTVETEPLVRAWDAVLRCVKREGRQLPAACLAAFEGAAAPHVKAQALCFLLAIVSSSGGRLKLGWSDQARLKRMLDEAIETLCSDEPSRLLDLAEEVPGHFRPVASLGAKRDAMVGRWAPVLRATPDASVFLIFNAALNSDSPKDLRALQRELRRRMVQASETSRKRLLMLYLGSVGYLSGDRGAGGQLERLEDAIPADEIGPIKQWAARIAATRTVRDRPELSVALEQFDFSKLEWAG